ncbi:uncharacterized protein LOC108677026, partial [Hyalella azteca]|uniref:Uncharacterized protein LOC108677026 n=1 Tax=Hyalella azteca TaxID=294128 RepID=A0A8B7P3Y1_HYAAZ
HRRDNRLLEAQKKRLLPEEFLSVDREIVVEGERRSKKMKRTLQTVQRGEIETVTVISSEQEPILNLPDLLMKLYEWDCEIHLHLLDTFFRGSCDGTNDSIRLEVFLHREFGERLASFYGHLTYAAWTKFHVVGLPKLGLHLQSGAGVTDVNKILSDNCGAETNTEPIK